MKIIYDESLNYIYIYRISSNENNLDYLDLAIFVRTVYSIGGRTSIRYSIRINTVVNYVLSPRIHNMFEDDHCYPVFFAHIRVCVVKTLIQNVVVVFYSMFVC